MATSDIHVLGAATLNERIRTNKRGVSRSRFTIDIEGESLGISLDPAAYGKPVAEAIAALFKERIRSIAAVAKPATIHAREVARRAVARGELWAMRRYSGGKIGTREPGQSNRLFNDSGRFAESFVVGARPGDEGFTVNVAANRLSPDTLNNGGRAALERIWQRLAQLVPELGDVSLLMSSVPIRRAISQAVKDNVQRVADVRADRVRQVVSARLQFFKQAGSALLSAVG